MALRGTDPEPYVTKYTVVYKDMQMAWVWGSRGSSAGVGASGARWRVWG